MGTKTVVLNEMGINVHKIGVLEFITERDKSKKCKSLKTFIFWQSKTSLLVCKAQVTMCSLDFPCPVCFLMF